MTLRPSENGRPEEPRGDGAARGWATAAREIASFDGGVRRTEEVARPDRYRHIDHLPPARRRIVRGGGYSYAAASFGAGSLVQENRAFDRVLAFDVQRGTLECEAGTTLGKIFRVATPHGWYLPVQPGYPAITVGGCIAADVHGKNQYADGNFRGLVRRVRLYHPDHGRLTLDRDHDASVLELTCGGFGLTGHILSAELQLSRLPGRRVRVARVPIGSLGETPELLEAHAPRAGFLYTWHNLGVSGAGFGRGFLYSGDFVPGSEPRPSRERVVAMDSARRGRGFVPALNRWTTPAFNRCYELLQAFGPPEREASLFDFLFPVARRVVYFHLFGRRGFHEYQMIVPRAAFPRLARDLERYVAGTRAPVTLASCKLFRGVPSRLRFDGDGICIALDFPRDRGGDALLAFLDRLVQDVSGLPNIVKDSRLPRHVVAACYPGYATFREELRRFDPRRTYASELSVRLDL